MNVPRIPRKIVALALLAFAALPSGCWVQPTAPRLRIETQQPRVSHVGRGRKPTPADSVVEVRYTPNPYFGHARSVSVVETGRRAWFTVTFDRPFRGRLGTDFAAIAVMSDRDSGMVTELVTEGAHRCVGYRLVWKQNPVGTAYRAREYFGTSTARIDEDRLVLEFGSDLLPRHEFSRTVFLGNPQQRLDPFAYPFGEWLQSIGHLGTEPVAIRPMSEHLSETAVH